MKINNTELINGYKAYIKSRSIPSRKCPSREDIAKAFSPKTGEKHKTKIIDHISECHHCAEEFEILRQIFKASQEMNKEIGILLSSEEKVQAVIEKAARVVSKTGNKQKKLLIHSLRLSPRYLSWAAGIIFLVIGIMLILKFSGFLNKRHEERGSEKIKIELIQPKQEEIIIRSLNGKSAEPIFFKWKKLPNTQYYVFRLFNEALILIYKSDKIVGNSFSLPPAVFKGWGKNKIYFWMVTAFSQTDKKVESDLKDFKLVD